MYTRSKSACRNNRELRGKTALRGRGSIPSFDASGTLTVTVPLEYTTLLRLRQTRTGGFTPHGFAAAYSLKPGFTETRLRPLARRRERTFWPPRVFMRVRNPCFLLRLRRLGWNVRLGMKKYLLLIRSTVFGQTQSINQGLFSRQCPPRQTETATAETQWPAARDR